MWRGGITDACRRDRSFVVGAQRLTQPRDLGDDSGESKPAGQGNQRIGSSKMVITDDESLRIEVLRDREGSFESHIIGKHEQRFTGCRSEDHRMYARGMTMREIHGYLAEMYGTEVSFGMKGLRTTLNQSKSECPPTKKAWNQNGESAGHTLQPRTVVYANVWRRLNILCNPLSI
jgi:hypothetical protein